MRVLGRSSLFRCPKTAPDSPVSGRFFCFLKKNYIFFASLGTRKRCETQRVVACQGLHFPGVLVFPARYPAPFWGVFVFPVRCLAPKQLRRTPKQLRRTFKQLRRTFKQLRAEFKSSHSRAMICAHLCDDILTAVRRYSHVCATIVSQPCDDLDVPCNS